VRKSIRQTLLVWFAAILVVVIGTFGMAVFHRGRSALMRSIERELVLRAHAAADSMEAELDGVGAFDEQSLRARFPGQGHDALFLVVFGIDGRVLFASAAAPGSVAFDPMGARASSDARFFAVEGPHGSRVVVGQHMAHFNHEMTEFGVSVCLAGVGALLLALIGGWFLVGRVLRPIDRMSEAAASVSASNLSARLDLGETESELGRLAVTLNRAFDRLEEAVARQIRFTADASHELRTPIAALRASAEWALRKERSDAEYRGALEACERAAKRMGGLVDGLLRLTRADAGEGAHLREQLCLAEILTRCIDEVEPLALAHEVHFMADFEDVCVLGDGDAISSLILALLSNAIVHGRRGGVVEVSCAPAGRGEALCEIADTGPGIPPKDLELVFQRFYRVDEARDRDTGGVGLGLAIARQVAVLHGGSLVARNRTDGGSVFTLRLPLAPTEPGEVTVSADGDSPDGSSVAERGIQ